MADRNYDRDYDRDRRRHEREQDEGSWGESGWRGRGWEEDYGELYRTGQDYNPENYQGGRFEREGDWKQRSRNEEDERRRYGREGNYQSGQRYDWQRNQGEGNWERNRRQGFGRQTDHDREQFPQSDWERTRRQGFGDQSQYKRESESNRREWSADRRNYEQGQSYRREGDFGQSRYGRQDEQRPYGRQGEWNRDESYAYDTWPTTRQNAQRMGMMPGPFTGRGPRGYQRSDENIGDDICHRLTQHGHIDATDIEVDVHNGGVTLKGTVNTRQEKRMAEDVAESVSGVKDVHNEIRTHEGQRHEQSTGRQPLGMNEAQRAMERARANEPQSEEWRSRQRQQGQEGQQAKATPVYRETQQPPLRATEATYTGQPESQGWRGHQAQGQGGQQWRSQLHDGMEVVDTNGNSIGRVKEARDNDFLIDRTLARDVFAPFDAIQNMSNDQVRLNVNASDVDNQGWEKPDLFETSNPPDTNNLP